MATTQTAPNFGALLDRESSSVDRPKPLPVGTYLCVVQGMYETGKSSKKQTEFAQFNLVPLQAYDDVDAEELATLGGLEGKKIRATYYITEDALWRLKEFLNHCGVEESEGVSLRQRMDSTPGAQVVATIKHEATQDGQGVYATLASTAQPE